MSNDTRAWARARLAVALGVAIGGTCPESAVAQPAVAGAGAPAAALPTATATAARTPPPAASAAAQATEPATTANAPTSASSATDAASAAAAASAAEAATTASAAGNTALPPTPSGTCIEHLPEGKERPNMVDSFPEAGKSGHRAVLEVVITHGLGERVLPGALQIQRQSDAAKVIEQRGFQFPDISGPAKPIVIREETANSAKTRVLLSLVLLPKEPGRHELELPPLPIAMARASGEVITLCTRAHGIVVDDPTVNVPNPRPKANPEPQRQIEFWEALRNAVYAGLLTLVAGALAYALARWWQRRPRPAPPAPPPRPPWEVALEEFHDIRLSRLIEQQRYQDHFDRVTHALRQYLGDRFGFDGLESTSSEIMLSLAGRADAQTILADVDAFLRESDLVRFADQEPSEAQCHGILERSEEMVRRSMPTHQPAPPAPAESSSTGGTS